MAKGQSLYDWCMKNGEKGQQLLNEFGDGNNSQQFINEYGSNVTPHDFSKGTHKKIKWTCKQNHVFYSASHARTGGSYTNCPYCAGVNLNPPKRNSINLYDWCIKNHNEQLINEWVGLDEDDISIEMTDYSFGTHKKVKWKCSQCGYVWVKSINQRTYGNGCPACANKVVTDKNSLETWCSSNGEFGNELKNQWVGITENNQLININEITYSSNIKVLWECKNGHTWLISPNQRTSYLTGCPVCNAKSTSYPEQYIYWSLKQVFSDAESRYKAFNNVEYDIAIPSIQLFIEYSGDFWHNKKESRDIMKKELCIKNNIHFIQIVDDSKNTLEHIISNDYICQKIDGSNNKEEILNIIVDYILRQYGHKIIDIDITFSKEQAWKYSHGALEEKDTLIVKYPELYKEWNHELNIIEPNTIKCSSHEEVYWTCINCNYGANGEWKITLNKRTGHPSGCPFCGYNWYKAQNGLPQKLKNIIKGADGKWYQI